MIKITNSLRERVRTHEGCVLEPYKDSLGKLTVGIGHLVQPHERKRYQEGIKITQEEADELFDIDINRAAAGADELIIKKIGNHDDCLYLFDSFFCFDRLLIETNFAFSTSWIASANFCAIFPRPKIPHLITILFTFLNI